jgi:hypothetical protein
MLGSKLRQTDAVRRGQRCNLLFGMSARTLAFLLLALLTLGLVAGCGGEESADSSTDVDQLLDDTFSGDKQIDSGRLSLALALESDGGQPVTAKISGPFQREGEGRLPQVDLEGSFEGGGQSLSGGITATADAAYVSFGGNTYEVAGPVFQQFKAGYEQSAKDASGEKDQSLASLGIDPRRWLTNARNEGEAKVGDTDTIKITGDVDVPKLLDDVNGALEKIRALGVQGSDQIPEKLTEAEKRQTAEAIEDLSVEIYTGADDRILRRIVIALSLKLPEGSTTTGGAQSADIRFDFQLLDVNEEQEIKAPENAKPFGELLKQFEGLGIGLGGLGGTGGANEPNVDEYSDCVQKALGDDDAVRKCADLLTTP